MNWGAAIAWAGIALNFGASVGYTVAADYRRALYFFFGACIAAVVTWR
jgi:hypothetical protein